jgi:hypothetical protein
MDFLGFLRALYSDWVGLMSGIGSIVSTVVGFFQHEGQRRKLFVALSVFCFFIGSVRVWTKEHTALNAERKKNALAISISGASVVREDPAHRVNIVLTLENFGESKGQRAN